MTYPIAIGILLAAEQIYEDTDQTIIMGKLPLDEGVCHANRVFPMTKLVEQEDFTILFVPAKDAPEASLIEDLTIYGVESLLQLVDHLSGQKKLSPYEVDLALTDDPHPMLRTYLKSKVKNMSRELWRWRQMAATIYLCLGQKPPLFSLP